MTPECTLHRSVNSFHNGPMLPYQEAYKKVVNAEIWLMYAVPFDWSAKFRYSFIFCMCVGKTHRFFWQNQYMGIWWLIKQRKPLIAYSWLHDDAIKWKHFPRYWNGEFTGIHRSPENSPHKGQWRGTLTFSLICVWTKGCANNRNTDDLRCHQAHYDVTVMNFM